MNRRGSYLGLLLGRSSARPSALGGPPDAPNAISRSHPVEEGMAVSSPGPGPRHPICVMEVSPPPGRPSGLTSSVNDRSGPSMIFSAEARIASRTRAVAPLRSFSVSSSRRCSRACGTMGLSELSVALGRRPRRSSGLGVAHRLSGGTLRPHSTGPPTALPARDGMAGLLAEDRIAELSQAWSFPVDTSTRRGVRCARVQFSSAPLL
jgi:hypothetical protein